jgi:hypothetical protein
MRQRLEKSGGLMILIIGAVSACSQQPLPQAQVASSASESNRLLEEVVGVPGDLLRPDQLPAESAKAADGDPIAAEKVASYYAFVDPKNKDTEFWIRIAIENGSALWIDLYAQSLVREGGIDRCRRALYFMRRAIELEPDRRSEFSARMDQLRSKPDCEPLKVSK